METVILTGDRDTFQLISPLVRVDLASSERDRRIVDETELAERYGGLTAQQQPDYKALVGDKSDNIPGVAGVGDKTATNLLTDYGTLEGIYEHIDSITQKRVHNNLAANQEAAFEYRFLTTINCDAPVTLDLDACRFGNYERAEIVSLMTALEFHSIVGRVPSPDAPWATATGTPDGSGATDVRAATAPDNTEYRIVATSDDLDAMIAAIRAAGSFAFDTESSSTDPMAADLAGLSFSHLWWDSLVCSGRTYGGRAVAPGGSDGGGAPSLHRRGPATVRAQRQLRPDAAQQLRHRPVPCH